MTKILLVDDDALVVDIYRRKLQQQGYEVSTATDGLEALKVLSHSRPDVVILDIMMPKFNGLEVLNFIRSKSEIAGAKVLVFSNFYISAEQRRAATAKADRELLKSGCTPARLNAIIAEVLAENPPSSGDASDSRTASTTTAPQSATKPGGASTPPSAPELSADQKIRKDFIAGAPTTLATLRQLNAAFIRAENPQKQQQHLLDFYRKIHYVAAIAGMAGCQQIAMIANAFEALLLELHEKPQHIGPSTLQTIASTLDFMALLFGQIGSQSDVQTNSATALVVDDDPISARAVSMALQRINIKVIALHDSVEALNKLRDEKFDLFVLDVLMPDLDGMELCQKIRALPQYKRTPVVFITGFADFQKRVQSVLSGGNDLIAKPIFPIELAVKAVTHLLRSQLPANLIVG